ncbi:MAG: DUF4296 domain-containing protein [Saprospiraceae bacterium]
MKILFPFLLFLIIICCRKQADSQVLSTDQISDILVDVYYLEAAYEKLPPIVKDSMFRSAKLEILKKFNVSDSIYQNSLMYYNQSPSGQTSIELKLNSKILEKIKKDSLKLI